MLKFLSGRMMTGKARQFFIIYCIGGSFLALALLFQEFSNIMAMVISWSIDGSILMLCSIIFYVYVLFMSLLGIYCGLKIADNDPAGKKFLIYYLVPQIPFLAMPGLVYYLKMALSFTLYLTFNDDLSALQGVMFNSSIGSYFNLNTNPMASLNNYSFGINLVPVILLAFLYKVSKKENAKAAKTTSRQKKKS